MKGSNVRAAVILAVLVSALASDLQLSAERSTAALSASVQLGFFGSMNASLPEVSLVGAVGVVEDGGMYRLDVAKNGHVELKPKEVKTKIAGLADVLVKNVQLSFSTDLFEATGSFVNVTCTLHSAEIHVSLSGDEPTVTTLTDLSLDGEKAFATASLGNSGSADYISIDSAKLSTPVRVEALGMKIDAVLRGTFSLVSEGAPASLPKSTGISGGEDTHDHSSHNKEEWEYPTEGEPAYSRAGGTPSRNESFGTSDTNAESFMDDYRIASNSRPVGGDRNQARSWQEWEDRQDEARYMHQPRQDSSGFQAPRIQEDYWHSPIGDSESEFVSHQDQHVDSKWQGFGQDSSASDSWPSSNGDSYGTHDDQASWSNEDHDLPPLIDFNENRFDTTDDASWSNPGRSDSARGRPEFRSRQAPPGSIRLQNDGRESDYASLAHTSDRAQSSSIKPVNGGNSISYASSRDAEGRRAWVDPREVAYEGQRSWSPQYPDEEGFGQSRAGRRNQWEAREVVAGPEFGNPGLQ